MSKPTVNELPVDRHKRKEFIRLYGEIGEHYREDDWMTRFAFWSLGWDYGHRYAEEHDESKDIGKKGVAT